jgi:hypothetical protein
MYSLYLMGLRHTLTKNKPSTRPLEHIFLTLFAELEEELGGYQAGIIELATTKQYQIMVPRTFVETSRSRLE